MKSILISLCTGAFLIASAYACNADKHETQNGYPPSDTTNARHLTIGDDTTNKTNAADSTRTDSLRK